MKRLILALLLLLPLAAPAQWNGCPAGFCSPKVTGGGAYSGPGDVVASATGWWGLRGYSAAYSTGSNPAIDIVDQVNANPLTVNILANGNLDVASINTWVAAHSVTSIRIRQLYDQTGNGNHFSQGNIGSTPELVFTGLGSLPNLIFAAANSNYMVGTLGTGTQPYSTSTVVLQTTAVNGGILEFASGANVYSTSVPALSIFAGGTVSTSTSTSTWYAFQGIFNGVSSAVYVNGSVTSGNAGTTAGSGAVNLGYVGGAFLNGRFTEIGVWPVGFNGTQQSNMNSNQRTYWGF